MIISRSLIIILVLIIVVLVLLIFIVLVILILVIIVIPIILLIIPIIIIIIIVLIVLICISCRVLLLLLLFELLDHLCGLSLSDFFLLGCDKIHLFFYQPFSVFRIFVCFLFFRGNSTLDTVKSIWLPVWMLLNFLLFYLETTLIRSHYHHWDLCFRHSFLRSSDHMVLQTKLEDILDLEKSPRERARRPLSQTFFIQGHFYPLFLTLRDENGLRNLEFKSFRLFFLSFTARFHFFRNQNEIVCINWLSGF